IVDKNGEVCISILHEPGEDKYGYEKPEERWLPIHTVETILISVISMLADPNGDSPANVDAAKEWREDRNGEFKRKLHFLGLQLRTNMALLTFYTQPTNCWTSSNCNKLVILDWHYGAYTADFLPDVQRQMVMYIFM
ncbi:hypothetical protein scyTo_0010865, partial [Scyliorhinus torazame]|nr:hypothetical protein [Scyliorhinus torazame]